jgi:predicted DNA-binding ribbon-helix-helix protein
MAYISGKVQVRDDFWEALKLEAKVKKCRAADLLVELAEKGHDLSQQVGEGRQLIISGLALKKLQLLLNTKVDTGADIVDAIERSQSIRFGDSGAFIELHPDDLQAIQGFADGMATHTTPTEYVKDFVSEAIQGALYGSVVRF